MNELVVLLITMTWKKVQVNNTSKKKLMLIDAQNQFIRAYIVDPSTSSNGAPIGGLKGFMKILNKLCREIKPDQVVIVWDGEGGSKKRRSMNKGYKAGRKPPKPRLNRHSSNLTEEQQYENRVWQQARTIEYLNETPVLQFYVPLVEADDVISYIKNLDLYKDWNKVIVSSDKDFIQLLDERTILFRPTQSEVLNKSRVVEKYGIHPNNFALARAIVGDPSDNLSGVPGVGLSTVSKRIPQLKEQQSLYVTDVLKFCEGQLSETKTPLKIFEKILSFKEEISLNYKIMQLSSPQISIQSRSKIKDTCAHHEPMLNKTGLLKHMTKDGLGHVSFSDLYETFSRICSNKTVIKD